MSYKNKKLLLVADVKLIKIFEILNLYTFPFHEKIAGKEKKNNSI